MTRIMYGGSRCPVIGVIIEHVCIILATLELRYYIKCHAE